MSNELLAGFSTKKDYYKWYLQKQGWYRVDSAVEGSSAQSVMYWNGEKWLSDMNYSWNNPRPFNEKVVICKMVKGDEDEKLSDKEIMKMSDEILEEYRPAFEALADKEKV